MFIFLLFFFSSRRRHTRCLSDWSSDVCSSDLTTVPQFAVGGISEVFNGLCAQLPDLPAPARGGRGNAAADTATAARGGRANAPAGTPFQTCVNRRIKTPVGMQKTSATTEGQVQSNVDELYRLALGLENPRTYTIPGENGSAPRTIDYSRGWQTDSYKGASRLIAWGTAGGKRAAFVRIPDQRATIIVLTNDDSFDAKAAVDRITDRLLKK